MAGGDQEDRTEAATPRRQQRAREEGRVPVSREVTAFAGLGAGCLILMLSAPASLGRLVEALQVFLGQAHALDVSDSAGMALRQAGLAAVGAAGPLVLGVLLAGAFSVLLQTGFLFNLTALQPDAGRLSPLAGLRRLAGADSLVEAVKSIAKIGAIGAAIWFVLFDDLRLLAATPLLDTSGLARLIGRGVVRVLLAGMAVQAAIAGADLFWVRFRHLRGLRMSRMDVRDETKEAEGDPKIKARVRQIRMQRARRRMLAAVPQATVVVTNPTHYAVALEYDRTKNAAPRVLAKGVDSMAARIREAAKAHGVPLVENPSLARALYRVELDTDIPVEHFQAVAEIIAYVWRLGRAGRPGRDPRQ
jgi:flagellar biosynthetic protein FlhB